MELFVQAVLLAVLGGWLLRGAVRQGARLRCAGHIGERVLDVVGRDLRAWLRTVPSSLAIALVMIGAPWLVGRPLHPSGWLWALLGCGLVGAFVTCWLSVGHVREPVDDDRRVAWALACVRRWHAWIAGQDPERALVLGGGAGSLGLLGVWAVVTWLAPLATIADGALGGVAIALVIVLVRSWRVSAAWPSRRRLRMSAAAGAIVGFAFAIPAQTPAPLWVLPVAAGTAGMAAWWLYAEHLRVRAREMPMEQWKQTPAGRRALWLIGMPIGWIFFSGPYLMGLVNEAIDSSLRGSGPRTIWPMVLFAAAAFGYVAGASAVQLGRRLRGHPPIDLAWRFGCAIVGCALLVAIVGVLALSTGVSWALLIGLAAIIGFFSSVFIPVRARSHIFGDRHGASRIVVNTAFVMIGVATAGGGLLLMQVSWPWVFVTQAVALCATLPFLRMLPHVPADAPDEDESLKSMLRRHWKEHWGREHLWSNLISGFNGAQLQTFYSTFTILAAQAHAGWAFRHWVPVGTAIAFLAAIAATFYVGRYAKAHGRAVVMASAILGLGTFVFANLAAVLGVDIQYLDVVAFGIELTTTLVTAYAPDALYQAAAANRASMFSQERWKNLVGGSQPLLITLVVVVLDVRLDAQLVFSLAMVLATCGAIVTFLALRTAGRGVHGSAAPAASGT